MTGCQHLWARAAELRSTATWRGWCWGGGRAARRGVAPARGCHHHREGCDTPWQGKPKDAAGYQLLSHSCKEEDKSHLI